MNQIARIIDANHNRAREALRVLEDIARFGLSDSKLAGDIKETRHRLVTTIRCLSIDDSQLLSARDVENDSGTQTTASLEFVRCGLADIARANSARLTESLRSLEESAKACGPVQAAEEFEQIRYAAYGLEKRLREGIGTGNARQWKLCVLITESLCKHHPWDRTAERALVGGADCLQLREKNMSDAELLRRARVLVSMAKEHRASVIINDRVDIAVLAGADGVHLGQSDISTLEARRIAGLRLLVGASTTNMNEAMQAARSGADYCGVGPIFESTTKSKPVAGIEYLADYLTNDATSRVPHLAIGGIRTTNVEQVVKAGGRGVAVSSAVCGSNEPDRVCEHLLSRLSSDAA